MAELIDHRDMASTAAQAAVTHEVRSTDGARLHAREWGQPDGPEIVFVHGWSQCDLCWAKQVTGPLADEFRMVTFDLRGHGLSAKPAGSEHYTDGRLWADDLAAVLEQTGLTRPVVVAWSYGAFVLCDYLNVHGSDRIAGIDLVGGAIMLTPSFDHIGPGFLDNGRDACASDLDTNIRAIDRFLRQCTAEPLPEHELRVALAWNMVVPPDVRRSLLTREIDGRAALAAVSAPVLVTHGTVDAIVLPSMAEATGQSCESARMSWYEGVGHMPFWEVPERFDRELAQFTSSLVAAH